MKKKDFFTAYKSVLEKDLSHIAVKDIKPIISAFDDGNKNVVFFSENTSFSTDCALKYAFCKENPCSKVIYARFDRSAYVYTYGMKQQSIDCVLKESLCRPFVLADYEKGICCPENYLSRFEKTADENTLVIIDGFDALAPSPYMRHLFGLECRFLVLCEKYGESFSQNAKLVCVQNTQQIWDFDVLDLRQKELLMTLCGMFEYLDESVPVVSSNQRVFDENSVRLYLPTLADEIPCLVQYGFIKILESGRIYIERALRKQVIRKLSPNSENCKTFMRFVAKMCDYRLLQNLKDISAMLYTAEDNYCPFAASLEFLCAYTYFLQSDEKGAIRLYNILVSYMLEKLSMQKASDSTEHLLLKNTAYYINLLHDKLCNSENLEVIYDSELYVDEFLPNFYTDSIKLELDIIRLCVCFIRNITLDMYKFYESVFQKLLSCMQNIFDYIQKSHESIELKLALLDDVIRLCSESFDYFCVVDDDGLYNYLHDRCDKRRVMYSCERESDKLCADSIFMGESVLTLSLYAKYAEYLFTWLTLSEKANIKHTNTLLKQIHEEKCTDRKVTFSCINTHYFRISFGYENYSDIYSAYDEKYSILNLTSTDFLVKRLEDNKRFLLRGFDGATKKGAEKYTNLVMNEIKNGKNPLNTAFTVLNYNYPLSDESYNLLLQKGFPEKLCNNKNISNLSLQVLLETLILDYACLEERDSQKKLYQHLILYFADNIKHTEAFCDRMYRAISSMYVKIKCKMLSQNMQTLDNDLCDVLYERYCKDDTLNPKFCDDYIAKALFLKANGNATKINKKLLEKALKIYCAENPKCDIQKLSEFFHVFP